MDQTTQLSTAKSVVLQLGISALVVLVLGFVGYKIAVLLINKWAAGDASRTTAISDGFKSITNGHASVLQTVNDNHEHVLSVINKHQQDELEDIGNLRNDMTRLDQKLADVLHFTPVLGVPIPKVILDRNVSATGDEGPTPVDRPPIKHPRAQTGPIAKPATEYGPFNRPPKKG